MTAFLAVARSLLWLPLGATLLALALWAAGVPLPLPAAALAGFWVGCALVWAAVAAGDRGRRLLVLPLAVLASVGYLACRALEAVAGRGRR